MTSEEVFDKYGDKVKDYCIDLNKENINTSAIDEKM